MPDAFGNALGYSIAEGSGQGSGNAGAGEQLEKLSQKQAATERVYLASADGVPNDAGGLHVWGMLPQRPEPVVEPPVATGTWTSADADDAGFFGGGDDAYVMDEARTRFQLDEGAKTARIVNGQIAEAKMMADARAAQEATSANSSFAIDPRDGMRAGPTVERALASGINMPDLSASGSFVSNEGGAAVGYLPGRSSMVASSSGFGRETASLGLDLLPVIGSLKSIGQLYTGTDLVTGEPVNRWLEAGGILLGAVPGGKALVKGERIADVVIAEGKYGSLTGKLESGFQAHHLNQNAAFGSIIPRNEGFAIGIRGNAFTEAGTPHFEFHKSLEGFWDQYRKGGDLYGQRPTNAQYGQAVTRALENGGISKAEASRLSELARQNRADYGLKNTAVVPTIPSRINQSGK